MLLMSYETIFHAREDITIRILNVRTSNATGKLKEFINKMEDTTGISSDFVKYAGSTSEKLQLTKGTRFNSVEKRTYMSKVLDSSSQEHCEQCDALLANLELGCNHPTEDSPLRHYHNTILCPNSRLQGKGS